MSSVITDIIDCPQCGLPAQKDEYFATGEERVCCDWCGYSHIKSIDGTIEPSKGYGSIHYVSVNETKNGSNQKEKIVRCKVPLDIIQRNNSVIEILSKYDKNRSGIYVWNDDKEELECLIGTKPKTLEERYRDVMQEEQYYRKIAYSENHQYKFDETEEFNNL